MIGGPATRSRRATAQRRARHACQVAQESRNVVARVAAEQLVGALAGQDDRDVAACQLADREDVHRVGEIQRQVVVPDQPRQQFGEPRLADPQLVMTRAAGAAPPAARNALSS